MKRIVVVGNQKGGVGKTTVSVNLAACWAAAGRNVILVDADPQESAYTWMGAAKSFRVLRHNLGTGMAEALQTAAARCDAIVVDLPPGLDTDSIHESLHAGTELILVARPNALDIAAAIPLIRLAHRLRKAARIVLNQQPPTRRQLRPEVRGAIAVCQAVMCANTLGARLAFSDSVFARQSVIDFEPNGKAASEIKALAEEVWNGQAHG